MAIRGSLNFVIAVFAAFVIGALSMNGANAQNSLYNLSATTIDGGVKNLSEFQGKVSIVVNVASHCGFTRQYEGLQKIYDTYKDKGLVVLGFPSNDFGQQEPGSDEEIKKFCTGQFGVTFPMFSKVAVLGPNKNPVYSLLTKSTGGAEVGWNFEKFLVSRDGMVLERFGSNVSPNSPVFTGAIEKALGQ